MKIRIEIDSGIAEEEIIIRSRVLDERVRSIQEVIQEAAERNKKMVFYKGETTYYLPLAEILFFETDGNAIHAHTAKDVYQIRYRLYELEELLPGFFMRVSKSTILNTKMIYAMTRSVSASCVVQFQNTHKQVYVSRYYYKPLKNRLEETR
ncbi:MAG TPA: LytTR family transcriptional regulator [Lachnospiraceae bacterium]|nr:LytTR family transcriptional regulator [Lachnospiraceae bacterium]